MIFRNYVADTPDRVVSAEPGYSSGRVRSAMSMEDVVVLIDRREAMRAGTLRVG